MWRKRISDKSFFVATQKVRRTLLAISPAGSIKLRLSIPSAREAVHALRLHRKQKSLGNYPEGFLF